jgi:hypothetical protein
MIAAWTLFSKKRALMAVRLDKPVNARVWFVGNRSLIETTAFRNGTLQGVYLIIAGARSGWISNPYLGSITQK